MRILGSRSTYNLPILGFGPPLWSSLGSATRRVAGGRFSSRRGRGLLLAVLVPMAIIAVSFGLAAGFGVVRFPGLGPGLGGGVLTLAVLTIFYGFVFLGEEIGWRGFLLFRLAELTSGRRAAVLTGAFHAISIYLCCCSPPPTKVRGTAGSWYR